MQRQQEKGTNVETEHPAPNFTLPREHHGWSWLSNLSCLLSPSNPRLGSMSRVQTDLMLESDPWYRRVFSNLRSLFSRPVTADITAQPVDTGLFLTPNAPFSATLENLKLLFGRQDLSLSGVTAKPIQTNLLLEPQPWLRSLFREAADLFISRPAFECTAQPVEVGEIFRDYRFRKSSVLVSVAAHTGILVAALLLPQLLSRRPRLEPPAESVTVLNAGTLIFDPAAEPKTKTGRSGGGGGGGQRAKTPASLGKLPRLADRQLTPPTPVVLNPSPQIAIEPTVIVPELAQLPKLSLPVYGDPSGMPGPPSAGPGTGAGIGSGDGHGVGSGEGPGVGPGSGGGTGDGPRKVGGGVLPPTVIFKVEPTYSEEARKARYQGIVLLSAIVRKDGRIQILKVLRGLGLGLDENAISALQQWKFYPGTIAGEPVDVALNIEINFSLR